MKQLKYYLLIIFAILIFLLGRSCAKDGAFKAPSNIDSLKTEISKEYKEREKRLRKAHESDSVRTKYVTRWREVKKEIPALPCDSALKIVIQTCDTIIRIDSTLISDLKEVIKKDSSIIVNQDKVIQGQDMQIVGLKKEVRRQKRQKRIITLIAVLFGGVAVVR